MEQINAKLTELMAQMTRRHKLMAMAEELDEQIRVLRADAQQLKEITYREQLDVDHLEKFSVQKLWYQLTGQLEAKLEQEEQEACSAALKYDAKRRELESAEAERSKLRQELQTYANCQRDYENLLREKAARLKEMNAYYADRICALEERIAYLTAQDRELREALSSADGAMGCIRSINESLSSARSWSTADLLGGGLISDMAKHSHLDNAQMQICALQSSLSQLRRELADVQIDTEINIQVDGFLRFADYFFDGLFADFAVRERISNAQAQVDRVYNAVRTVQSRLEGMQAGSRRELDQKKAELDELVKKA